MYAHPSAPFNFYLHPAMAGLSGFKASAPIAIKSRDQYEEQKARAAYARQCRQLKRDFLAKQGDLFPTEGDGF